VLRWEAIQDPLSEAALQGVGETGVEALELSSGLRVYILLIHTLFGMNQK